MDVALRGQGANHVAIEAMYTCVRGAQIPFCSHPGDKW